MNLDPVAIYGAILSTMLGMLELAKYFRDRPRLKLDVGYDSQTGELVTRVTNNGQRPITITGWGATLFYAKGENDLLQNLKEIVKSRSIKTKLQQVEMKLNEGESAPFSHKILKLAEYQVQYIWIDTATGKMLRSKKWPLYHKRHPFDQPRPELKVEIKRSSSMRSAVRVKVTNSGNVPIGLNLCSLKFIDGDGISFRMPHGGITIQSGKDYETEEQKLGVPEDLVELASVQDHTSHIWCSRKWPLTT